jgi:Tryptophan dimethylallyltransferase
MLAERHRCVVMIMSAKTSDRPARNSLFDMGAQRIVGLTQAMGLAQHTESAIQLFAKMVEPWGRLPLGERPLWPSYIGDDHTPAEFSITVGASRELRFIVEPLGNVPSLISNQNAALALLDSLASEFEIDLRRFERVRDLFCPSNPAGRFAVWIAAAFSRDGRPEFKIYLNPSAQGPRQASALLGEALARLGLRDASLAIERSLLARGRELDELTYFSLDLSGAPDARAKVYARHASCTADDLEAAASSAASQKPGDVTAFLRLLAPGVLRFDGRAPSTCLTFTSAHRGGPVAATTHFPINDYAPDDGAVVRRVRSCLAQFGIADAAYTRALESFATRPLDCAVGAHSYVSFRRFQGSARVTAYLALEAYSPGAVEGHMPTAESGIIDLRRC